ncbi:MAG: response regulator [Candidatus Marinimicrobia bacterium]|nr:response regulator [Candidatus Neomarinimicrobiota bacterium]
MREKTIVIIEDELIIARDLQAKLEMEGYIVPEVYSSGPEALSMLKFIQPDIALIDIQLESKFDGIETAERIRLYHDIPVIYITAHVNEEILEKVKLTQPVSLLLKPINYTELITAIELGLYKNKIETHNKRLLEELQTIVAQSNILRNMKVPVCSKCNSIREDNSNWTSVEEYMKKYYNIEFTESVCPNCLKELFPVAYGVLKNRSKIEQRE